MKQIYSCAILTLTVFLGSALSAQLPKDTAIAKAEAILRNLQENKSGEVAKEFSTRMAQELSEARLKNAWPSLVAQFGAFKNIKERREGRYEERQAVELILVFEKETVVQRILLDNDGKVSGLVFRPLSASVLPAPQ